MFRVLLALPAVIALGAATLTLAQDAPAPATAAETVVEGAIEATSAAVEAVAPAEATASSPAPGLPPDPTGSDPLTSESPAGTDAHAAEGHAAPADPRASDDAKALGLGYVGHGPLVSGDQHDDAAHADAAHGDAEHAEEHHGPSMVAKIFNFVVFVGILTLILGKSIRAFFRQRKADIANSLESAELAQREAQAKLADTERRLAGIETQVAEILSRAREQAAAEHALILEQAKAEATRILGQAEAQVGDLEGAAVRRLKGVAANLAVELARELVEQQLQPKDREEIFNRTLSRLQKAAS